MKKYWNSLLGVSLTLLIATASDARTIRGNVEGRSTTHVSDSRNPNAQAQSNSGSTRFSQAPQNAEGDLYQKSRHPAKSTTTPVRETTTKKQGFVRFSYSSSDQPETTWKTKGNPAFGRSRTGRSIGHTSKNHEERKAFHRARTGFHSHHREHSRVIDLQAIKESENRHHSVYSHKNRPHTKRFIHGVTRHNHVPHFKHHPHRHHTHYTTRIIFIGGHPVYYYPSANYYYYAGSYHYYSVPKASYESKDDRTLYELGFDWGKALLYKSAGRVDFVNYLEDYIVPAPTDAAEEFRSGFLIAYGDDAEEVFNQAMISAYDQAGIRLPSQYR